MKEPKTPYVIDSIETQISSPVVDSLYELHKRDTYVVQGNQYRTLDFTKRDRLTTIFRNSGLSFEREFLTRQQVNTDHKVNVTAIIKDRPIREGDTTIRVPFKVHKINQINIYTFYL